MEEIDLYDLEEDGELRKNKRERRNNQRSKTIEETYAV